MKLQTYIEGVIEGRGREVYHSQARYLFMIIYEVETLIQRNEQVA